jgi:hypothetical protein
MLKPSLVTVHPGTSFPIGAALLACDAATLAHSQGLHKDTEAVSTQTAARKGPNDLWVFRVRGVGRFSLRFQEFFLS